MIDLLNLELAEADRELAAAAKADPIARRLMTVPGVGPATSMRFVAAVDEISRFMIHHGAAAIEGVSSGPTFARRSAPVLHAPTVAMLHTSACGLPLWLPR